MQSSDKILVVDHLESSDEIFQRGKFGIRPIIQQSKVLEKLNKKHQLVFRQQSAEIPVDDIQLYNHVGHPRTPSLPVTIGVEPARNIGRSLFLVGKF